MTTMNRRFAARAATLLAVLTIAGCGAVRSTRDAGPAGPGPAAGRAPGPALSMPSDAGPSRPGPIAERTIQLAGRCNQTDEDGFGEDATVDVRDNRVVALSWHLKIGRRGSCRFEFKDFRQVQTRPHIELSARNGSGCKLMIWQEPRRVTLAHAGCQAWCTPGVYEKAWPTMFDPSSGGCARIG